MKKGIGLAVIAALAAAIAASTATGGPKSAAKSQSVSCKSTRPGSSEPSSCPGPSTPWPRSLRSSG
jgi:hypothetical protein